MSTSKVLCFLRFVLLLSCATLLVQTASTAQEQAIPLSADLQVNGPYLNVPVANYPRNKKDHILLGIYTGDALIQNFTVSLPREGDTYWIASYPLQEFNLTGKAITIRPVEETKLSSTYQDAFRKIQIGEKLVSADDYKQPWRDQFHVTARRGWNNDPNGLVYKDGVYHMYFQHNPFGIYWGNMHWGHFTSKDLIHWVEHPIALYANTIEDAAFSGGGFIDFNDSSGLGKHTQFVAFTSTGRGECLAYSKDGGMTLTELPENPLVEHTGRDPKVIWYSPEQKWVMALYDYSPCEETNVVPARNFSKPSREHANIAFYESRDLRNWTRTGAFTHPDRDAVFECPELFRLPVEGMRGETRWVLYGAQNRYFIGQFNGKTFVAESGPHGELIGDYSTHGAFYAAQTFSDLPNARRVQIGWMRRDSHEGIFPMQSASQGMTLPHEITLRETKEGIRAFFNPVSEVEILRTERLGQSRNVSDEYANSLLRKCNDALTEVIIEFEDNDYHELVINGADASFTGKKARIFTDRTVTELYIDDGLEYEVRSREVEAFFSSESYVTLDRRERLESLEVYRLKSIWE